MQEDSTFWDYVNGGKLNARDVRKARQLEVEYLDKMGVFERAPCNVARSNTRTEPIQLPWEDTLKSSGIHRSWWQKGFAKDPKHEGFANFSATPPLDFVKMMISMVASALKDEVSRYGEQNVARCEENGDDAYIHSASVYLHAPNKEVGVSVAGVWKTEGVAVRPARHSCKLGGSRMPRF